MRRGGENVKHSYIVSGGKSMKVTFFLMGICYSVMFFECLLPEF